jgi:hypothetical protein
MNLRDYLLHHDGPGKTGELCKNGRELQRLHEKTGLSVSHLYAVARQKKAIGRITTAERLVAASRGRALDVLELMKRPSAKPRRPSRSNSRR